MRFVCLLCTVLCLNVLSATHSRADEAILIGGGYNVNGSQGQIELNVKWVQDVLKKAEVPVITFFTDGDDPAPDVHYLDTDSNETDQSAVTELAKQLEPVARLFGNQQANQRRYRNHDVEDVQGSTTAETLTKALEDILTNNPDEPRLIVYNGHGKQSQTSPEQVTMELWNDTQMTAADLHSILDRSRAPNRFVFTQCYSGGFHRLAYENPAKGLQLSENTSCGFTAESAYRLAEGCSASVDTEDYRDYSTYFFAALDGYDRDGRIVPVETDTNGDGNVSLREAHLYTVENAHSTDLSRSTSEDYLASWQPWYLKWVAERPALQNNEYAKIFRALAAKHSVSLKGNPVKIIRQNMQNYTNASEELTNQQAEVQSVLAQAQQDLIYSAQSKWPSLATPYTATFQSLSASGEMLQVANWLREQSDYQLIVDLQNEEEKITKSLLEVERNLTQMQKMLHFRNIANLKRQLYEYGTSGEISDYEKLVACEDTPLSYTQKISSTALDQQ